MSKFRVLVKGIVQYQDSYLAVERWYDDRIFDPYQWEFIDGEMEFGETPEKAVERIVAEKTGVAVQVNKPLYTGDLPQVRFVHVELLFCVMHRWMK